MSARHGQFQEKEKNVEYWIEYVPSEKNFRRKITILELPGAFGRYSASASN